MEKEEKKNNNDDEEAGKTNHSFALLFESLPLFGVLLFVFSILFPPFEVASEANLSVHMLQHVLIAVAGVFVSYPLYRAGRFDRIKKNTRIGAIGFFSLSALIVFWHLPLEWDAAVLNPAIHIVEYLCFFLIGLMIGVFVPMLPDSVKMLACVVALSAHMFYGFILYLLPTTVYTVFPASQQATLGIWLFAPSPIWFVAFLYFLPARGNKRLGTELMSKFRSPSKTKAASRIFHLSIAALSVIMIISLIGYFSYAAFAVENTYSGQRASVVVYIEETPYSWQYTPSNIVVVIGVNNTVEWVNHSYIQDTVTSANGLFNSGPIGPGGTWTHIFTTSGTFSYECLYHPWMKGTVTVLSSEQ